MLRMAMCPNRPLNQFRKASYQMPGLNKRALNNGAIAGNSAIKCNAETVNQSPLSPLLKGRQQPFVFGCG
jgi:hypothetical protein